MEQSKFYQIKNVTEHEYTLVGCDGSVITRPIQDIDKTASAFTIQDAKDGDVLACNEEILLFKSYSVQGRISLYCWYNGQTNNFHSKEVVDTLMTTRNKICPATKEQRNQLEKAMTYAGYIFDFEKKELKKIEQKPAWSEEDERMYRGLHNLIYSTSYCDSRKEFSDFLNSLKDRVQPHPKQEWSEDDEYHKRQILRILKDNGCSQTLQEKTEKWIEERLKSIRPHSAWKPSEEMIEALGRTIPENVMEISEDEMLLDKLYQGLKYGRVLSEN